MSDDDRIMWVLRNNSKWERAERPPDVIKYAQLADNERVARALVDTDRHGMMVLWEPGVGKSAAALCAAHRFLRKHRGARVVIAAPAKVQILSWPDAVAHSWPSQVHPPTLVSHQLFVKMTEDMSSTMVIIDEAHRLLAGLEDPDSTAPNMADRAFKICKRAKKVLLLTGSPVITSIANYATLLAVCRNDAVVEPVPEIFITKHKIGVKPARSPEERENHERARIANIELAAADMQPHSMCFVSHRARPLHLMAKMQELDAPVPLSAEHVDALNRSRRDNDAYRVKERRMALVFRGSSGVLQVPKIEYALNFITRQRAENARARIMVYCEFFNFPEYSGLHIFRSMEMALRAKGIPSTYLTGEERDRDVIEDAMRRLNFGMRPTDARQPRPADAVDVVFLSKTAQTGINLFNMTHVIFLTLPWTYAEYDQALSRAWRRNGHDHPNDGRQSPDVLTVIRLVASDNVNEVKTIDGHMLDIQNQRKNMHELLVNLTIANSSIETNPLSCAPESDEVPDIITAEADQVAHRFKRAKVLSDDDRSSLPPPLPLKGTCQYATPVSEKHNWGTPCTLDDDESHLQPPECKTPYWSRGTVHRRRVCAMSAAGRARRASDVRALKEAQRAL